MKNKAKMDTCKNIDQQVPEDQQYSKAALEHAK